MRAAAARLRLGEVVPAVLRRSLALALFAALLAAAPAAAWISPRATDAVSVNRPASALAEIGGQAIVGGSFVNAGRFTGSGAVLDGVTGLARPGVPTFTGGDVEAVVGDGAGGWFVGGSFDHVGRAPRAGLAHLTSGGRLDRWWAPAADGPVTSLALRDGRLYAAGGFTSLGGASRAGLGAVSAWSGRVLPWRPPITGEVRALTTAPGRVFVAGNLDAVGGEPGAGVTATDPASGAVLGWNAGLLPRYGAGNGPPPTVDHLFALGSRLYMSGSFSTAAGPDHANLAAVSTSTGAPTGWLPAESEERQCDGPIAARGSEVYVAGCTGGITEYDASSGAVLGSATAGSGPLQDVLSLTLSSDTLYVGAVSFGPSYEPGYTFRAYALGTLQERPWADPATSGNSYGAVKALAAQGRGVFAGGGFDIAGGRRRVGIAGVSLVTGDVSPFNPVYGSEESYPQVRAVAAGSGTVVFGGSGLTGGAFGPGDPAARWRFSQIGDDVSALAVAGARVYVGGRIPSRTGDTRLLSALDLASGAPLAWNPPVESPNPDPRDPGCPDCVKAILPVGDTVYVAGNLVSGTHRNLVAIDARTGAIREGFAPDPDGPVNALAFHDGRLYAGGEFTQAGGGAHRNLVALDARTGRAATGFAPEPDGPVNALAARGRTILAGGTFASIGGAARHNLAALRERDGRARRWAPEPDGPVTALLASGCRVLVGGAFTHIASEPRVAFAQFRAFGR